VADDFWAWRARYAPFSPDDVNRMERPGGIRDWSGASIERRKKDLAGFEARWKKLNPAQWPIPQQVDYKLIGSALSRVRWELELNPRWKTGPEFLHRTDAHRAGRSAHCAGAVRRSAQREILTRIETFRRSCSKAQRTWKILRLRSLPSRPRISTAVAITSASWRTRSLDRLL
jgi:hypothetical protein